MYHAVMFSWIRDGVAVHSAAGIVLSSLACIYQVAANGNAGQQLRRSAAA